jgi:hypothetical protein
MNYLKIFPGGISKTISLEKSDRISKVSSLDLTKKTP